MHYQSSATSLKTNILETVLLYYPMDAKLKRRKDLCCNCQEVQQHGALPVSTVSLPLRAMFTIDAKLVIVGLRISRVYSWCISNYGADSAQRENAWMANFATEILQCCRTSCATMERNLSGNLRVWNREEL